ncbi:DUF1800 domain-containing protein [Photobacterium sp. DA100]|uniref:DUF1800 domain-containing protein n=1 Tax=Photobacterium sp. DA100 TaxID=3027472 RepID=UPI00247A7487|nr:DUF1800 domain-containing protein [Photobacterium sp. DA100]WEM41541.1 DUF1800 domain-containing protein [Photobacterium sp. DA100]
MQRFKASSWLWVSIPIVLSAPGHAKLEIPSNIEPPRGVVGEKYRWVIPVDYDGEATLSWSSENLPDFIWVNGNGVFWAKPWADRMPPPGSEGYYPGVTFTVTDGTEASTYGPFTWIVEPSNNTSGNLAYPRIDPLSPAPVLPEISLTTEQAASLLFQATFGPKVGEPAALSASGFELWFDEQVATEPSYHLPRYDSYLAYGADDSAKTRYRVWWDRSINAPDQLRQRIAFALSQILVVSEKDATLSQQPRLLTDYYDLLIEHALGNYRALLLNVSRHPAMGYYLTAIASQQENPFAGIRPNENYPRELMQLFTIGLDELKPDGRPYRTAAGDPIATYSEADIGEFSRVLTGWHLAGNSDWDDLSNGELFAAMAPNEERHDSGSKQVMGLAFAAGQSAEQDLQLAIDILFNHPNTPVFVSRILIQRLVTSNPTPEYIERVASAFRNNGEGVRGDLATVAKAILTDPEARNGEAHKLKEPLIVMTNLARAMAMRGNLDGYYRDINTAEAYGQIPLGSPSVFNFYRPEDVPDGSLKEAGLAAPEFTVLNTSTFKPLLNTLHDVIAQNKNYDTPEVDENNKVDISACYANSHVSKFAEQMAYLEQTFYHRPISDTMLAAYRQFTDSIGSSNGRIRCKGMIWLTVTSPEYLVQE